MLRRPHVWANRHWSIRSKPARRRWSKRPRKPWWEQALRAVDTIRADTAFVMTNLLRGVVQRGTVAKAAALNWPLGIANNWAMVPLFPGYLFVEITLHRDYHQIIWTPGVKGFVAFSDVPRAIQPGVGEHRRPLAEMDPRHVGFVHVHVRPGAIEVGDGHPRGHRQHLALPAVERHGSDGVPRSEPDLPTIGRPGDAVDFLSHPAEAAVPAVLEEDRDLIGADRLQRPDSHKPQLKPFGRNQPALNPPLRPHKEAPKAPPTQFPSHGQSRFVHPHVGTDGEDRQADQP